MANNTESLNRSLYDLLRSKGYRPKMLTTAGKTVPVPEEAAVFIFNFVKDGKDYGQVSASIDGARKLIVYFDDGIADSPDTNTSGTGVSDSWSSLIKHLSKWRFSKGLRSFELKNQDHLEPDMAQRDHMEKKEKIAEGYYPMGKQGSYSDAIPNVKIIIQHSRKIEEGEQRYRNVARIFVENMNGERFLIPTTKPGIAQVYARHIAEGGTPYDDRAQHINSLVEEHAKMAGFVRATKNGQFNESTQRLVQEGINHYNNLRETLSKMRGHRGYNMYFESWTPSLMEDDSDTTSINELFVQETLDPRIESVMPILSKLQKNIGESSSMKEVDALAEWADNLLEGGDGGEASEETDGDTDGEAGQGGAEDSDDAEDDLMEAPGAETLAHNEKTVKGNLDAFDLEEGDGGQEALNAQGIPEEVDMGQYDAVKTPLKGKDTSDWDKNFREKLKQYTKELDQRQKEKAEKTDEGLDADQKRVGQLGPTEKVKNNNIGKLVGVSESFINTDAQAVVTEVQLDEGVMDSINGLVSKIKAIPGIQKFIQAAQAKKDELIQAAQHSKNGQELIKNIQAAVGGQQAVAEGWGEKLGGGLIASAGGGLMAAGAELFMRAWNAMGQPDLTAMTAQGNYDGRIVLALTTMLVLVGALSLFAGGHQTVKAVHDDELRKQELARRGMQEGQEDLEAMLRIINR